MSNLTIEFNEFLEGNITGNWVINEDFVGAIHTEGMVGIAEINDDCWLVKINGKLRELSYM